MRKPSLSAFVGLFVCWLGSSAIAPGQSEKVVVRLMPKPGTTVHYRMTQEMDFDIEREGTATPEPMKMLGGMRMATSQKTGTADADGRFETELVYDELSSEMKMNGKPLPGLGSMDWFVGKKIRITYDRDGTLLEVKAPGLPVEALRQMITSFYGILPAEPMGIGDTARMPFSMALPIPILSGRPSNMEGHTTYKLVGLDREGSDRLARLEQSIEAKLTIPLSDTQSGGPTPMSIEAEMKGSGTVQLNLDRGLIQTNDTLMTIDMKIAAAAPSATTNPNITMHGQLKMTIRGSQ